MTDQPILQKICGDSHRSVDVIFVHGLSGDATETWRSDPGGEFWPSWFADDCPGIAVYSLGYPTALFEKWAAKEMDMYERAGNVLEHFAALGIGEKPIVFVTYSLGGILTKMVLRKSSTAEDEGWRRVAQATRLVVFLSTPHTGSSMAAVLNVLPMASKGIKLLANEFGALEDLNLHFRSFANGKADLDTVVYYEKHATHKVAAVVSRESADVNGARKSSHAAGENQARRRRKCLPRRVNIDMKKAPAGAFFMSRPFRDQGSSASPVSRSMACGPRRRLRADEVLSR